MRNLTDRMKTLKARTGKPAESITPAVAALRALARNAPRHRGAEGNGRRSRRAEALLRLPEGTSPALREFVASQFDLGRDWSHAVAEAAQEGRRSVQAEPREQGLTAEEQRLIQVLGLTEEQYLSANAGR